MSETRTFAITPPPASGIRDWYEGADLLDSYAVALPAHAPDDARVLARLALERPPAGFRLLMGMRDSVMSAVGIKTSADIRAEADGRDRIDFFPVIASSAAEVVLGEDDRHLDFRTAMTLVHERDRRLLVSTTSVRSHNRLGHLYLAVIRPFHLMIVRHGLERLARRLKDSDGPAGRTDHPATNVFRQEQLIPGNLA